MLLGEDAPHHDLLLRLLCHMSDADVVQVVLDLVNESGAVDGAVAAKDDIILIGDLHHKCGGVVKWPLDGDRRLVPQVNLTKHRVPAEELNALARTKLETDWSRLLLQAGLLLKGHKQFSITSCDISSLDLPGTVGATGGKDLGPAVLVVCGHHEHDHDDQGHVQEHKSPHNGDLIVGLHVVVEVL